MPILHVFLEEDEVECDSKGVSTCRRQGEGMQLPYSQYRGRNAGGY